MATKDRGALAKDRGALAKDTGALAKDRGALALAPATPSQALLPDKHTLGKDMPLLTTDPVLSPKPVGTHRLYKDAST